MLLLRLCIAGLALLPAGCGGWSVDLPNDYRLITASAYNAAIARPEGTIVVDPHVVEYAVMADLIVGRAEIPRVLDGQPNPPRREPGYFLLDTRTGGVVDSLSKEAWLARLRERGVTNEPDLARPTIFD